MEKETQQKINRAVRLLRIFANGEKIEVAYSGGKDSDVLLWLVRKSGVEYVARYKNTTIDPPGTITHCKDNGVEILRPKMTFLKIVETIGFPHRNSRYCCRILKEYNTEYKKVATGVRREESEARKERYSEPTSCFNGAEYVHPLLDFTTKDIEEIVNENYIKLHPLYYDNDGTLRLERRLGCLGCPLANRKQRIAQYKMYPKLLLASIRAQEMFIARGVANGSPPLLTEAWDAFCYELFYSKKMKRQEYISRIKFGDEKEIFYNYFGL